MGQRISTTLGAPCWGEELVPARFGPETGQEGLTEAQGTAGKYRGRAKRSPIGLYTLPESGFFDVPPHGAGSVTRADVNYIFSSYFSYHLMYWGKRFPAR